MKEFFKTMTVRQKLWSLVILSFVGITVVSQEGLMNLKQNLLSDRQERVKHLVDVAHGVLQHYAGLASAGKLSEDQAKQGALSAIQDLRYDKNNYFWINDMKPAMVMHPIKPKLNGKDLSGFKDPDGKHLFVDSVDTVKRQGAGFVDYKWPKPGFEEPVPKISYVKGFAPWGWVIGSGIYLDDVDAVFMQSLLKEGSIIAVLLTLLALIAVLVIRTLMKTLRIAAESADAIAAGDLTSTFDDIGSKDELGRLMKSLKTMQHELYESIEGERARKAAETGRIKTALDNVSGNVMVADAQGKVVYLNKAVESMFGKVERSLKDTIADFSTESLQGCDLDRLYERLSHQSVQPSQSSSMQSAEFEVGGHTFRTVSNPVFGENGERLGTAVEWSDRTAEVTVEREVQTLVEYAKAGDLSQRIDLTGKSGFFEKLSNSLNAMLEVSERVINDTLRVLASMAGGNLTETISANYEGTFGQLKRDANAAVVKLTELIGKIKVGTDTVSGGAGEISQGNANLSQRTEQQAANLEETASSMEQMTATVKQNADNARQANQLASGAREQAEKGGQVVGDAVSAMGEISAASKKIADIIGVIDEIAFQTNLLALNAAVEAARAGEQGRGFAVVASEVRNLAQRSATAAKEIKALIQDSVTKVEEGSQLVDQSGQTLEEIVTAVKRVSDIIAEIAAASAEQSSGIEQVNKAIMQMDEMTQQNAALVEQAAAASEAMDEQARIMKDQMEFFTLDEQAVAAMARKMGTTKGAGGVDFADVRSKHLLWKSRLRRFLDGEEAMTKEQAVSHKHCDLGKWLYPAGLERYGHMQEMQQLEKVHKHLHEVIHRIVDLKHAGKAEQAEREFAQVESISQQVVSLLNAIERHVKQNAGQGPKQAPAPQVERRTAKRPWVNSEPKLKPNPASRRAAAGGGDDSEWEEF